MAWKELAFTDEVILNSDISEAEGFLRKTGAGTYEAIKTNMAAAVAPTANEDSGDGYAVGSRWFDTTADKEYVCLDASAGSAVWVETTGAGGVSDHGALTGLGDDDHTQYLLVDGTRAMTGSLDVDGNDITLDSLLASGATKYIGLSTGRFAACFIDTGHFYTKIDMHDTKIENVLAGTAVDDAIRKDQALLLDGTQPMAADINFAKHNADAMCIQPLGSAPSTPGMAQMYYNTGDNHLYVYAS